MAGFVNLVILIGNLGKDPEVRTTQDGQKIVTLSLATSESWTDRRSGERKERTEWHRLAFSGGAHSASKASCRSGRAASIGVGEAAAG